MSTETKHTPGPWKFENVPGAGLKIFGPIPFKANCVEFTLKAAAQPLFEMLAYEIWLQFPPKEWDEMQEANARLIAASPELFHCLKRIIEELPSRRDWLDPQLEYESRAAIAKAEGRNEPAKIN